MELGKISSTGEISYVYNPKTVVITGATGSFGQALINFLIPRPDILTIRCFSRDEFKQSEMQKKFNSPKLRFFVGDVRDEKRLQSAFQGADIVIHAAAMKQVPACEYNPFEAVQTNILGTQNVITACLANNVDKAILLSTDKAVDPVNLYGATKLVAEKLWLNSNRRGVTKFSVCKWGNIVGSRGSVIPLFREQAKKGTVTVTDKKMTRFWIKLEEAVRFVWEKTSQMRGGEVYIPNIRSARVVDVVSAVAPKAKIKYVGIREGEKIHETLGENYFSNDPKRLMSLKELQNFLHEAH